MASETTPFTLASTQIASLAAAVITYPAESWRIRWTEKTLRYWNPEEEQIVVNRNLRLLSPLIRLSFNELASSYVSSSLHTTESSIQTMENASDFERQLLTGAIAGGSHALLFTPFEAWRAMQVLRGGSIDPEERRARAIQGLGLRAAREMLFNVTFFPMFHMLRDQLQERWRGKNDIESFMTVAASGIASGVVCGAVCAPMDISIAYMMNSRERWSLWSGTRIFAAPLATLSRGLIVQGFCFGPAFGIVAAIYEHHFGKQHEVQNVEDGQSSQDIDLERLNYEGWD
eukprot:scaffold22564_cov118-Cylindrotheca_fusiformis.AAC.2